MYHLDMSVWAYEKLAQTKWGVIAIEWRDVPCWYKPKNAARLPYVSFWPLLPLGSAFVGACL